MTKDNLKTESEAATGREASVVERLVMCEVKILKQTLSKAPDFFLTKLATENLNGISELIGSKHRNLPAIGYFRNPVLISTDLEILNT